MYALPPVVLAVVLVPAAPTLWLAPTVLGPAPVPVPTPKTPVPAPPTEIPETPIPVARLDAVVEAARGEVPGDPRPAIPEAMAAPPMAAPGEEPGAVEPTVPLNPGVEAGGAKLTMLVCARFAGAETLLVSEGVPAVEPPALPLPTPDVTAPAPAFAPEAVTPEDAVGAPVVELDGSVEVVLVVLTEVLETEVIVMTVVVGLTTVTLAPPPLTGVDAPPFSDVVAPLTGLGADVVVVDVDWPTAPTFATCAT